MAFTGKNFDDTYAYSNPYLFGRIKTVQGTHKRILDQIPMGLEPLGTEKDTYYDDEYMKMSSLLDGAYTAATDTTVDVTAGEGTYFRPGDQIQFGAANITYKIASISTDTLTIGAAAHYGTKANASSGAAVRIVARAELAGADALVAARDMTADPLERTCHSALIKQTILISKDAWTQATKYGKSGAARIAMEENKAINAGIRNLVGQVIMGYSAASESATVRGSIDGLLPTFKDANTISGGSLAIGTIIKSFTTAQGLGMENCDLLFVSPDMFGEVAAAFTGNLYTDAGKPIAGMAIHNANTVFGDTKIVSCPLIRSVKTMLMCDTSLISLHNKEGMAFQIDQLARAGDYYKAQLIGRYGQKIYGRVYRHAYVTFS